MKQIAIFLILMLAANGCYASQGFMLDEKQLFTQKKGCYINYLTEKNTSGWYIKTNREECDENGFLSGYHHITVYNGFSKPVEHLSGHFSNGYWTGEDFIKKADFYRFSDGLGVQKATFDLAPDTDGRVHYIAQIITQKTNSGTYPPFKVCNPMRIMAIHQNKEDFKDAQFLQRIFNHVEQQARLICPKEKEVMLFLSATENPNQEDISVFVQMNLKNRKHKIIHVDELNKVPVPHYVKHEKSETVSVFLSSEVNQASVYMPQEEYETAANIFNGDENLSVGVNAFDDSEITPDLTDIQPTSPKKQSVRSSLMPKKEIRSTKTQEQYVVSKEKMRLQEEKKISEEPNEMPEELAEIATEKTDDAVASRLKAAAFFNSTSDSVPDEAEELPLPKKSYLQPLKKRAANKRLDENVVKAGVTDISSRVVPARHAFLISKVLNTPVLAQAAVHVEQMTMDNTGTTDMPVSADVEGGYMQPGWHLVKGYFMAYKQKETNASVGLIRLIQSSKCSSNLCRKEKP